MLAGSLLRLVVGDTVVIFVLVAAVVCRRQWGDGFRLGPVVDVSAGAAVGLVLLFVFARTLWWHGLKDE